MLQEKNLLTIIKWGIYLILALTPLLIFSSLIFPYITSKTIFFRMVIDIVMPFFLFLIIKYPAYRPRKSWLFYSLLIFNAVVLITSIFGINILKSMFGDLERMWGVFTLLHFLAFFTILISVFKEERHWQALFRITIISADLVALYGLAQRFGVNFIIRSGIARIESTLGNAAFIGGYFLLIMGLTAIALHNYYLQNKKLSYFYLFSLVIQFFTFFFAGIRGAYIAFIFSIFLLLVALILYQKNKTRKIIFFGILVALIAGYFFLYFNRFKPWVNEDTYLSRLTSIVTTTTNSVRTRFVSWGAGINGWKSTPLLGIGMENYGYYFDKYLPPRFYSFSRTETWFDRAHNAVVEVMVANGLLGLISYLLIFIFIFFYLLKIYRQDKEKNFFVTLIFSLIVMAYFIQNFFVFDTLVVFMVFTLVIAYLNFIYLKNFPIQEPLAINVLDKKILSSGLIILTIIIVVVSLNINYKMLKIAKNDAAFQYAVAKQGDYALAKEKIENVFAINSWLDYMNNKSANLMADALTSAFNKKTVPLIVFDDINLTLAKLEKDVSRYPAETYSLVVLGRTYNILANYYLNNNQAESAAQSLAKAMGFLEKGRELSPGRLQIFFLMAQNKMMANDLPGAKNYLAEAIAANPDFPDSYWFMGITLVNFNQITEGLKYINLALDKKYSLDNIDQTLMFINYAAQDKDYQTIARLYEVLITLEPKKVQYYASLATTYAAMGNKDKAIFYARIAGEIDPSYSSESEIFIQQVENGTFKLPE